MKNILKITCVALFAITMNSCKKCKNEEPTARIINNGTQKASVQIKTSGGNTVNINNIMPSTSSAYSSYAAGQVTFTIDVQNVNYVKTLMIENCYSYDIAIDGNNNITTTSIDKNN